MRRVWTIAAVIAVFSGCARMTENTRGIADRRSDYSKFIAMRSDPSKEGLKEVRPYFKSANRSQILAAIERACQGERTGSSVLDEASGRGYYVNCNPRNRQLLNGYVPSNPRVRPHSR